MSSRRSSVSSMPRPVSIALGAGLLVLSVLAGVLLAAHARPSSSAEEIIGGPFDGSNFYDKVFEMLPEHDVTTDVIGVVVNHHLLAPNLIAQALAIGATMEPETIVLIAPDHFAGGAAPFTTSHTSFETPYGTLDGDEALAERLVASGYVLDDAQPYRSEHGITNITAFIAWLMPEAHIVPLIVRDDAVSEAIVLVSEILASFPERTMFVGSFDFTHEATMQQAESNDVRSLAVLEALDTERVSDIAIDSRPGIEVLLRVVRTRGAERFVVTGATNSARVSGNHDQQDVTSYVTGYFY